MLKKALQFNAFIFGLVCFSSCINIVSYKLCYMYLILKLPALFKSFTLNLFGTRASILVVKVHIFLKIDCNVRQQTVDSADN